MIDEPVDQMIANLAQDVILMGTSRPPVMGVVVSLARDGNLTLIGCRA